MSSVLSSQPSLSPSYRYDVFVSFRGEDVRNTFLSHFYTTLERKQIKYFVDDENILRGDDIATSLFEAVEESRIAVVIFSKNYTKSSWCLKELVHIKKCRDEMGQIVLPIFYEVEPREVKKLKRKSEEAFSDPKAESDVTEALANITKIAGWDPNKMANCRKESEAIMQIADEIWDKLRLPNSDVDQHLVIMGSQLQDLESLLTLESGNVRMVGIWGIGGIGKTTLANSLYKKIYPHFHGHYFLENVREESSKFGLKKLQENMLSTISDKKVKVWSVEEGKSMIKNTLCNRKVLVLLDDVDQLVQLEALAGQHDWFGSGSRIIITTRDVHLLNKIGAEVYPMRFLSRDEAIYLFNKHAYNEKEPIEYYRRLSSRVISYADGHPFALKVLASFLYDKDKREWDDTLAKLKDILKIEIMEKLRISYDELTNEDKELFLDIACFFKGEMKDEAMEILKTCHKYCEIGIKVLRQKALIRIVDGRFDMHKLVQKMGQDIVRGGHLDDPEKHSRVWKHEEIRKMCLEDATMDYNCIQAVKYRNYVYDDHPRFCKLVSNMKKLRWLRVWMLDGKCDTGPSLLSKDLRYIQWDGYPASPFPDSFKLVNLVFLKLSWSKQKELWKDEMELPSLKVLHLSDMKELRCTPDISGLPCLEKLTLSKCDKLKEIHSSFENCTSLVYVRLSDCPKLHMSQKSFGMNKLMTLEIEACGLDDGESPSDIDELPNLRALNLSRNNFSRLDFSLSKLTQLKLLNLSSSVDLLKLPKLPSNLVVLNAYACKSLTTIGDCYTYCKWLRQVSLTGGCINGGMGLLESMLKGKAIENHSMLLLLEGLEVAKKFTPTPRKGNRYTLELLKSSNEYWGFLVCAVFSKKFYWRDPVEISMEHGIDGKDSQQDVKYWEEGRGDKFSWVGYVSFDSLRHTTWSKQFQAAVSFNIEGKYAKYCGGLGVTLVAKESASGPTTKALTSTDYTPNFKIERDSVSALSISLSLYEPVP